SLNVIGSMILDINGNRLDAKFLNGSGAVKDSFTIQKGSGAPSAFNFSLTNGGSKSVSQGASVSNSISATLVSGTTQAVTFSASGLPTGASALFSSTACSPTCSTTLTIKTSSTTPTGTSTLTVTGKGGVVTKTTSFSLTVAAPGSTKTLSYQNGVLPTSLYAGTRDTVIDQTAPTSNYGTATTLRADGDDGTGKDVYALLRWTSLTIPTGSTVKSVTITLNVTNPTSVTYELYALKRNWVETGP